MSEWETLQLGGWAPCQCGAPLPIHPEHFTAYFSGRPLVCDHCNTEVDWWKIITRAVREDMFGSAFAAVGAQSTLFRLTLRVGTQATEVRFADYGIPPDAKLLHVNYTPQSGGGVFPIEVHGNEPPRHLLPVMRLYPLPIGAGPHQDTEVGVFVTWVHHGPSEVAWEHLVTAVRAYRAKEMTEVVVPANVAVEMTLTRLLNDALLKRGVASGERIERFFLEAATYSHQLNVIMPLITTLTGHPALPADIRGLLNRLRDLRNEVAHSGQFKKTVAPADIADCLAASIFGVHYCTFLREALGLQR